MVATLSDQHTTYQAKSEKISSSDHPITGMKDYGKKFGKHQSPTRSKTSCGTWQRTFSQLDNLQRKGIVLDTSCPLCHSEAETVEHLFMNCNLSKLAMFASPLGSHAPFNMGLHSWLLDWLSCADKDDSQLFCTILWKLWYARNQAVFNGATTDPVNLAHTAVQFIQEFNATNVKQRHQPPLQRRESVGMFQVVSHHMFFKQTNRMGADSEKPDTDRNSYS